MNDILLSAEAISKSYRLRDARTKATIQAVDAVSLHVQRGETLGLAGESGCGKSTVAKLVTGLLPADSGSVSFEGKIITPSDRADFQLFRRSVQMVFQDPFSSLNPRMRIGDTIAEPLVVHRICTDRQARDATIRLMEQVGLSGDQYDRFPHEFSGGQRQRIGIARALAIQPRVLVADEPVSSLDISIQAQIINLLQQLKHHHGLTMLMVSHDLGVLRHISDRIAVMYLGCIVELAPAQELFKQCFHPYTQALLAAIPKIHRTSATVANPLRSHDLPSAANLPNGCRFHPRCPYAEEICRTASPLLLEQRTGHYAACHISKSIFSH